MSYAEKVCAREGEGEEKAPARREGTGAQRQPALAGAEAPRPRARGNPLGKADDRSAAGIATEKEEDEKRQKRYHGQQKGAKLGHGDPG